MAVLTDIYGGLAPHGRDHAVLSGDAPWRLASRLSALLLRPTATEFDRAVADGLRQVADALDADLCLLAQFDAGSLVSWKDWVRADAPAIDLRSFAQAPWLAAATAGGRPVPVERWPGDRGLDGRTGHAFREGEPLKSILVVPVSIEDRRPCALVAATLRRERAWPASTIESTQLAAEILACAVYRRHQQQAVELAQAEAMRLRTQLESENRYLKEEIATFHESDEVIGDSPAFRGALMRVQDVAPTDSTVLLLGETGTGKELFARAVHERSHRRQRPLVSINCAALPASLIESELFGHERGAFTGAISMRQGRFELAHRGTIFLDEIGDLPLELQAKLLRVLQEGEFERLGSSQTRKVDVRVVAATHRDLEAAIDEGKFRADLYYRLSVFPIRLPPLRHRPEDIPRLVWFFVHRRQRALHRRITKVPASVMDALTAYSWPGNVRELENVVERAMIRSTGDTLVLDDGIGALPADNRDATSLQVVERRQIEDVLRRCSWRINGARNAAEQLGLHPNTLRFRMKKLGITRPAVRPQ